MAIVSLSPLFNGWQGFTAAGIPLSGGFLNTYLAGTSTPAATYTTNAGTIANSNPIVLDGGGRPPGEIWQITGQAYRYVLTDSTGSNPLTYDNIAGLGDQAATLQAALADTTNAANGDALVGTLNTATGGVARTQHARNQEDFRSSDFSTLAQAVTAAAGAWLRITANATVSSELTISANTKITQDPGTVITLAVTEIGLKLGGNNIELDGLIVAGTSSRAISSVNGGNLTDIVIRNCDISGATLAGAGYTSGIFIDGLTNGWIENNYLHGNGIGASTASINGDITIYVSTNTNVNVIGNRCASTAVGFNIAMYNSTNFAVTNNNCSGALTGASNNNGYGILVYDSIGSTVKRGSVTGNVVKDTQGTGIYLQEPTDVTCTGNVCDTTCTVQTDGTLPVAGIALNTPTRCTVSGNVIKSPGRDGIVASNGVKTVINANTIELAGQAGIRLRGNASRMVISSNSVDGCSANVYTDATGTKTGCVISNNSLTNATGTSRGIDIQSLNDSLVSGNVVSTSGGHGIIIIAGTRNIIESNKCLDNGANAANTYSGIFNQATNSDVRDNLSGNSGATGQQYGITSNGNYCLVQNNDVSRNQTDGHNISGTNTAKFGNRQSTSATPGQMNGSAVLVAGTVTVSTDEIRTGDVVWLTCSAAGGTQGIVRYGTIVNATSFVITSTNAADTSTYLWRIEH
jgi:parallel beta-helix repeat protein